MPASIRGHQTLLKFFLDGGEVSIANVTQFDVNQDASFSRSFYVGAADGEGDTAYMGWSGSFSTEVKDASVDEIIDDVVQNNKNGVGVADITILDTEYYTDGTSKSYVYSGIQLKMGKSVGTLEAKVTKKLDFQADRRTAI